MIQPCSRRGAIRPGTSFSYVLLVERVVGLLKTVGINYADSLQVAVGGRYTELDSEWNVRAHWETADSPKIVNWRGQLRHHGHMALVP